MKTTTFTDRDEWMRARNGKITGSKLKGIIVKRGTEKKIGFYELIAERLLKPMSDDGEELYASAMIRGSKLEKDALDRFESEDKRTIDRSLVLWERDDCPDIAISPDGVLPEAEAVEAKCLASARHIEAYITQTVPDEYYYQGLQYFIVNEKLETLHFVFYDPRLMSKDFFTLQIHRKDLISDIETYLDYQRRELIEVEQFVQQLTKTPN